MSSSSGQQHSVQYQLQQQQMALITNKKSVKQPQPSVSSSGKQQKEGKQQKLSQNSQFNQNRLYTENSQGSISQRQIFIQQCQKSNASCLFCNKCRKASQFSSMISTALYSKYSASQNYYFTKDINDILANQRTSAVIQLKDIQTYDEVEEFLNRYYHLHEYDNKIKRLTEYYKYHRDIARLFMVPTTNILNKFHDKKRRIYYIQITRMLKEKDDKDGKKESQNGLPVRQEAQNEIQKMKGLNVEENIKKDEKDLNIDNKNNGPDQFKSLDVNERFLAPLDDLDEQTKSVQSNTLQDLNHKLNDILMNSTKSMQSYLLDQDVSQSIGNLSNFLNHLKIQNNQQPFTPQLFHNQQRLSENINEFINPILTQSITNEMVGFNGQQFQNILQKPGQISQQPQVLNNQASQQNKNQDHKNLIKNSQNIKQFLKKDSFLKKQSGEQSIGQHQQNPLQINSINHLQSENSIIQQVLINNSPPASQRVIPEILKSSQGSKTDRGSYSQSNEEKTQGQISKINQEMISLGQHKLQIESNSAYNSKGHKEQIKETQKGGGFSHQPSLYPSSIQSINPTQHQSLNERQGSHFKQQSINSGGYNNYQVDGQISGVTRVSANNTLTAGNFNGRTSEKNSANQSTKEAKNYDYPFKNALSEFTTGKQSNNQSIERNSLNSLQHSINGIGKQLNAGGGVGTSLSSAEQSQNGLQSKLMSNTSSKYQSSQNKEQRSSQNLQVQNTSGSAKLLSSQINSSENVMNKKINNLISSESQVQKKLMTSNGQIISQIPLPTNSTVQMLIQNQQNQQQSLSQQLSQQFQQQFSQQLQNYQRSQVVDLQQYSAAQRQLSQQSKNDYKNDPVDIQRPPNTDRSQYSKKTNQQTLSQKNLSARDKELSSKVITKGIIDLNAQKLKAYEAMNSRRENQLDIQVSLQKSNLDNNIFNDQNSQGVYKNQAQNQLKQNEVQMQNYINNNHQNNQKLMEVQQYSNLQSLIQAPQIKSSLENVKTYANLLNPSQNQQNTNAPAHLRTQTLESYRDSNIISSDNQSYSQSQQASRNQSKNKQNSQFHQYSQPSQQSSSNQHQQPGQLTNQQSRQGSQQKSQQQINPQLINQQIPSQFNNQNQFSNENLNIYTKYSKTSEQELDTPPMLSQIRQQANEGNSNKQQENQQSIPSSNEQLQPQQSQVLLKKSLSNYKFENLGELKQIYKEVQKRTAAMFQKHKDSIKNTQTAVTNQSIQDLQQQKQNSVRQKQNYYTKGENQQKGSMTQRGLQNSQDQSQSKEISPRIHRIQKSEQSNYQNNSLLKQNSERESNSRRVSSQIKSNSNFNNSYSQKEPMVGQKQQYQQSLNSQGNVVNIGASQLILAAQQIAQNSREQAITTTQKKLQYKQQASKNGSEINSRMIHSNPNADFNKTSYISSYNNSVNNTNIYAPGQQNGGGSQQGSGYSTIINNFGSNSQINTNSQLQSAAASQQNSSKKILDKIKHTRISSMNAASLLNSQNHSSLANPATFKSQIPIPQTYRQQSSEFNKQALQQPQQALSTNHTQFMVSTQNSSTKKKIHHKYTKSEADSLTQSVQHQNLSQQMPSQSNLGLSQVGNSNSIGNKQLLLKQMSLLQGSQSQQHLQGLQGLQSSAVQNLSSNQQLQSMPSQNLLTQQNNSGTAPETKRQISSIQQTSQNSQSPQRNSYNSTGKKTAQQYFTYSNNNIINIFVNNHQENGKVVQAGNVINNQNNHMNQNINSMINNQINLNKIQQQQSSSSTQSQKSQNSPLKKASINQGKISARQSENFSNVKI